MKKITLITAAMFCLVAINAQLSDLIMFDGENFGIVFDGEGGFAPHSRFNAQSAQVQSVALNPAQDGVNASEYVLQIVPNKTAGADRPANRCILMIRTNDSNVATEDKLDINGYTNFKFKYYAPHISGNIIRMQWEGNETNPAPAEFSPTITEMPAWEQFDLVFPSQKNWAKFQLILNQNQSWVDDPYDEGLNNIYLDDIMVTDNSQSGVQSINANFESYIFAINGQNYLAIEPNEQTEITAELYSLAGQKLQTIFSGAVSAAVNVPLNAQTGVYIIKLTDGKYTSALKATINR
ncbi:MAG: T9SS type A sorting domain-containing protein [Prevotellaceae bacterium]|jgi:hypothetical protein|nr:T9SS type A sorting domain-containing protein [Prevotellaceae bacterium]